MDLTRRRFLKLMGMLGAGASTISVWGCTPQTGKGAPSTGLTGDLVIVEGVEVENLDPHQTTSGTSRHVLNTMYDRIVEADYDQNILPGLATSWKLVNDLTWEFELRKGITFHNGEKFDARAVQFSVERLKHPDTRGIYGAAYKPIEVEIVNDHRVRIHTETPQAGLLEIFAFSSFILPPKSIESGQLDPSQAVAGTGAYKLREFLTGERLVTDAGPAHFGGGPNMKTVTWKPVSEASTRASMLRTGAADIITPVPPVQVKEIEDAGLGIVRAVGLPTQYVSLNQLKVEAFRDKRVRKALNHAVDKQGIIDKLLAGAAEPLAGPFGPGTRIHDDSIKPYAYDPQKARELLASAGYPDGFEVTLSAPQGRYINDTAICELIAAQWSAVGVRTSVKVWEWGTYVQGIGGKTHDCFLLQHAGVPEDVNLEINVSSRHKGVGWQGYENAQVDQLIEDTPSTMDSTARAAKYKEIFRLMSDDAPWVFLYNPHVVLGISKRLQGFAADPAGRIVIRNCSVT